MRRLLLIVTLFLLTVTPVAAEDASWTADPPKQVGMPGLWCTASASVGGDHYSMRNYAPLDDGFDAERYARRVFADDVVRAMRWRFKDRPHEIQPSDVTVTCGGGR